MKIEAQSIRNSLMETYAFVKREPGAAITTGIGIVFGTAIAVSNVTDTIQGSEPIINGTLSALAGLKIIGLGGPVYRMVRNLSK